jgi:hypothetical protein
MHTSDSPGKFYAALPNLQPAGKNCRARESGDHARDANSEKTADQAIPNSFGVLRQPQGALSSAATPETRPRIFSNKT